jgi:hypothetical protein
VSETTEWLVVLAGYIARREARKERQRETRRQLAANRAAGLERRYAEKQQRMETK